MTNVNYNLMLKPHLLEACKMLDKKVEELRVYEMAMLKMHAMLHPENYPPGHPLHDKNHMYWEGVEIPKTREEIEAMSNEDALEFLNDNIEGTIEWFDWPGEPDDVDPSDRNKLMEQYLDEQEGIEHEPFQWSSDTIEWVDDDLRSTLRGHPLFNR